MAYTVKSKLVYSTNVHSWDFYLNVGVLWTDCSYIAFNQCEKNILVENTSTIMKKLTIVPVHFENKTQYPIIAKCFKLLTYHNKYELKL